MKFVIKNIQSEYIRVISSEQIGVLHNFLNEFSSVKEPLEASIFAIDEIIDSSQLVQFKSQIEKINIISLEIYSNNRETILSGKSLKIESTFVSKNKITEKLSFITSKIPINVLHKGTVRSGDRISSNGDLFILGDVNPGAIVSAKNNVYVWGKLLGIALAGEGGNRDASISSLYLNPLQLRISDVIAVGPKEKPKNYYPEIAVLHDQSIIIKPLLVST